MVRDWVSSLRNLVHLSGASLITKASDFVRSILVARNLAVSSFGIYWSARVAITLLEILLDFGLNAVLVRRVATQELQASRFTSDVLGIRVTVALLLIAAVSVVVSVLPLTPSTRAVFIVMSLSLLPNALLSTLLPMLNARDRLRPYLWSTTLTNLLTIPATWLMVRTWGIWGAVALASVQVILQVAFMLPLMLREGVPVRLRASFNASRWKELVRAGFPFLLLAAQTAIYWRIDVLMLSSMRGPRETAYYAVAYRFIDAMLIIPPLLNAAIMPMLCRLVASGRRAAMLDTVARLTKYTLVFALFGAVVVTATASPLILWLFRDGYRESIPILLVLVWTVVFTFVNSPLTLIFYVTDQPRRIIWIPSVMVVVNVLCNAVFIPRCGALGAAVATVITEAVGFSLVLHALARANIPVPLLLFGASFAKAASAGGVAIFVAIRVHPVSIQVVTLMVAFWITFVALGGVGEEDRRMVRTLLALSANRS